MKYIYITIISLLLISCKENRDLESIEETFYVRHKGADMPVYIRGNVSSNVVILVIHGGPGGNGYEYRSGNWSADLEKDYAIAYWDQRGQGMSHGKYDKGDVTISLMVEDMNAVVNVLKAKFGGALNIFALGHSWGGTLSAKYMITENYQNNLSGWIEVDGAHDIPQLNKDAITMFIQEANNQISLGNNITNWQSILDWANTVDTSNISSQESQEINSKARDAEKWLQDDGFIATPSQGGNETSLFSNPVNPITGSLIGLQTANLLDTEIEETALTHQLSKVTIPSLFLWGKFDFVVPPTLAEGAFNAVNSTIKRMVIFEESGHSPMDNEWEKFNSEIRLFIENNKIG